MHSLGAAQMLLAALTESDACNGVIGGKTCSREDHTAPTSLTRDGEVRLGRQRVMHLMKSTRKRVSESMR